MSDEQFAELVSRLLDDDLTDDQRRQVERRISEDPEARRTYEELRLTVQWVRSLGEEPAPASLLEGVRERLDRPPWRRRWTEWLVGGPILSPVRGLAFVLVAAIVIGVLAGTPAFRSLWSPGPSPPIPEAPRPVAGLVEPAARVVLDRPESAAREIVVAEEERINESRLALAREYLKPDAAEPGEESS